MFWLVFTLVVFLSVGCFLYADVNEKKGLWLISGAILILIILSLFVFFSLYLFSCSMISGVIFVVAMVCAVVMLWKDDK
jgi:hypothetical protein